MRTIVGLLAIGALMTGCTHDKNQEANNVAIPATPEVATARPAAVIVPETTLGPVDPAAARAAWKDGVSRFDNGD